MFRNSLIESYNQQEGVWDEMVHSTGGIRSPYENFFSSIGNLQVSEMTQKDEMAKKLFMSQGITFTVYSSGEGIEKIFPFDIVLRITEVKQMLQEIVTEEQTPLQNSINLSGYVYNNFKYEKGITSVKTKLDAVWKMKGGVCQDFAHILVEFLRMIDIPARYVSGYICPKNKELRGEGATPAWVEVCVPYYGWLGLDPTNNCIVNDRHIRLATGRNFADCTPVKGTYKGSGEHTLSVSVEIKNGTARSNDDKPSIPKFSYHAKNPGEPINSYRYYLEVQRKQQQQQQQ